LENKEESLAVKKEPIIEEDERKRVDRNRIAEDLELQGSEQGRLGEPARILPSLKVGRRCAPGRHLIQTRSSLNGRVLAQTPTTGGRLLIKLVRDRRK
jgi:hypothetical protein